MQCLHLFMRTEEDLNNLMNGIHTFHAIYMQEPYVICSAETCDLIPYCNLEEKTENENVGRLGVYCGSKVLIDDTLPFGEIRLR